MSELTCAVRRPSECSREELRDFAAFVVAGGEVAAKGLPERLEGAHLLAFLRSGPCLVGVAGLKYPNAAYRARVSQGSRVAIPATEFEFELGWIFVLPSARGGKSLPLCTELLAAAEKKGVFATTRTGNTAMHKTLLKLGFEPAGRSWPSRKNEDDLLLFVRSAS